MKMIKVKYTDLYGKIEIRLVEFKFCKVFERNKWTSVPEPIANKLLQTDQFICEEDVKVTKGLIQTQNTIESNQIERKIAFKRTFALGDVIMLVPIARYIKRAFGNKIYLITSPAFVEIFNRLPDVFDGVFPIHKYRRDFFDKIIYLDGVLECDHSTTNHQRQMHRVHIYEEFLEIKCDSYDFTMQPTPEEMKKAEALLNVSI